MLPVRRSAAHARESRRATQRPLTSCVFLLVAFSLIYICCVLVSFFRDHDKHPQAPIVNSSELEHAEKVDEPEAREQDASQHVMTPPPEPPALLDFLHPPHKRASNSHTVQPDRIRAQGLEYELCPASAYTVPKYGPLLLLQRGTSTACATYLYPASFARTTPLLPALPALSDPLWQSNPQQPPPTLPQLGSLEPPFTHDRTNTDRNPPDPTLEHHFKDPVLSPEQLGRKPPNPPPPPDLSTPEDTQGAFNQLPDISTEATERGSVADEDISSGELRERATGKAPPPPVIGTQDEDSTTGGTVEASTEHLPGVESVSTSSARRRLAQGSDQDTPSDQEPVLTRLVKSGNAKRVLKESDEAAGVLAAAIMLAAEEMQGVPADLERISTLHTPPATASLPEDIARWSHVQLDRAVKMQAAWRAGNVTELPFPHTVALLNHPSRRALSQAFASSASCVLRRLGGAASATPAANLTAEQAAEAVVSWPQYLSYEASASMPTGRETSVPGALMRGVYVAHANGTVILDFYDPRAPLDSEEVQDTLPELYRVELRTGDLAVLPPWILTSILPVPPIEVQRRHPPPPTMHQLMQHASTRSRYLGLSSSVTVDTFQEPPHSTHAAILHLALPGDPSLTAGSIIPMHMGPLKPPPLSQLQDTASRRMMALDDDQEGAGVDVGVKDIQVGDEVGERRALGGDAGEQGEEWADEERRTLQLPQRNPDSPPEPLRRPQRPDGLRAPGDVHRPPHLPATEALRAPARPGGSGSGSGGAVPVTTAATTQGRAGEPQAAEEVCADVDRMWFSFGSPVAVYSLQEVDPELDLHALRSLALIAFDAFKKCLPNNGAEFDRESPGSLGDELFDWQARWPEPGSSPCDGGKPGPIGERLEREWRAAYTTYLQSNAHSRMLRAVATVVVSMLKRMGKDDLADDRDPGIFSWLTVHDESMSYHGRHYHRHQALTAVLYLELPHESAPLEFSNPIEGPDSQPNGRAVFVPNIGDFVLFPSYLPHTVPMRLLKDRLQPRISIAYNIWLEGPGLDRFAEGAEDEERDSVGKHQYFAVSDVTLDRHFIPREGLDLSIERDDHIL